jgi:hypothetical protein
MLNSTFIKEKKQQQIIHKGSDAITKLSELGLSINFLKSAIIYGYKKDRKKSPFAPRTYGGMTKWGETCIGLREVLIPLNWELSERYNLSRTISPTGKLGIVVSSGNAGVSNENYAPTTLNKKGELSVSVVEGNNEVQLNLFPLHLIGGEKRKKYDLGRMLHWFLLYYNDGNKLWFELSLPRELNKDGRISSWFERIIFSPVEISDIDLYESVEQPEEIDFEIQKKY